MKDLKENNILTNIINKKQSTLIDTLLMRVKYQFIIKVYKLKINVTFCEIEYFNYIENARKYIWGGRAL